MNDELYHYGVKGMKWGVRRYQNKDGSLTAKGVKRYAKAGYAEDAYKSNTTSRGKVYDKLTGAHKHSADIQYDSSSANQNRKRAEKYVSDYSYKQRVRDRKLYGKRAEKRIDKRMAKGEGIQSARHTEVEIRDAREKTKKGAKKAAKVLTSIGKAYVTDQLFFGGAGTQAAKSAVKNIGRFAISAIVYAQGGRDIRWYDN